MIEWVGRRDQGGKRGFALAACAASLLPGPCNGTRIAGHHRSPHASDIDSKFEGICCDHRTHKPFPESPLDLVPMLHQVTAAIPPYSIIFVVPVGRWSRGASQISEDQFNGPTGSTKNDGLHIVLVQVPCHANALQQGASAKAEFAVYDRRVVDQEMPLPPWRAVHLHE